MRCTIHSVRFDPSGKANNYQEINPLHPLQEKGSYDISLLVYEIVTKDFGYLGTDKYTLTLKNNEMVLEIWERPDGLSKRQFGKLEYKDNKWISTNSTLPNQQAVSTRLSQTLSRINQAYQQQHLPSSSISVGATNTHNLEEEWERLKEQCEALRKVNETLLKQILGLETLLNL